MFHNGITTEKYKRFTPINYIQINFGCDLPGVAYSFLLKPSFITGVFKDIHGVWLSNGSFVECIKSET